MGILIWGPRLSGKTTVVNALCEKTGMISITYFNAMKYILSCCGNTTIFQQVVQHQNIDFKLWKDELLMEMISIYIQSYECQRYGWIIDGIFSSLSLLKLAFFKYLIQPHLILFLSCDIYELCQRNYLHPNLSMSEKSLIFSSFAQWKQISLRIETFLLSIYGCGSIVYSINSSKSIWNTFHQAMNMIQLIQHEIQQYHGAIASEQVALLHHIAIPYQEIISCINPTCENYCPVCLSQQEYVATSWNDRQYVVEYKQQFYSCCSMDCIYIFNQQPQLILKRLSLVENYQKPKEISLGSLLTAGNEFEIEFQGYCPVTFAQGKNGLDWQYLQKGSLSCMVNYNEKNYVFLNQEKKFMFMKQPLLYSHLILPHKLPPNNSFSITNCPSFGKIEQQLSKIINLALMEVGNKRLKYPLLSCKETALIYLALYLKANNPNPKIKQHQIQRYQSYLHQFEQDCELTFIIQQQFMSQGNAYKAIRSMKDMNETKYQNIIERFDRIADSEMKPYQYIKQYMGSINQ